MNVSHLDFCNHLRPIFLGKIQVVLGQSIFGIVAAADHAAAAEVAAGAFGAFAVEVRIGHGLLLRPEEDAHLGGAEGLLLAALGGDLAQHFVGLHQARVAGCAEHFTGGVVMRTESLAPGQRLVPGRRGESRIVGDFEHVGVSQTAAAHTRAVQHHHAFQRANLEYAKGAQGWHP